MMEWYRYFMNCIILAGTVYAGCPFHGNLIGTWEMQDPYGSSLNATITFGYDAVVTKQERTRMFLCKEIDFYERVLLITPDRKGLICLQFPFVDDYPIVMVRTSPHYVKYSDFFKPTPVRYYRPSIMNTCDRYSHGEMVYLSRR